MTLIRRPSMLGIHRRRQDRLDANSRSDAVIPHHTISMTAAAGTNTSSRAGLVPQHNASQGIEACALALGFAFVVLDLRQANPGERFLLAMEYTQCRHLDDARRALGLRSAFNIATSYYSWLERSAHQQGKRLISCSEGRFAGQHLIVGKHLSFDSLPDCQQHLYRLQVTQ